MILYILLRKLAMSEVKSVCHILKAMKAMQSIKKKSNANNKIKSINGNKLLEKKK